MLVAAEHVSHAAPFATAFASDLDVGRFAGHAVFPKQEAGLVARLSPMDIPLPGKVAQMAVFACSHESHGQDRRFESLVAVFMHETGAVRLIEFCFDVEKA